MLDIIPGAKEMKTLVGDSRYDIWIKLNALIEEKYEMECLWSKGGKAWKYENVMCIICKRKLCGIYDYLGER